MDSSTLTLYTQFLSALKDFPLELNTAGIAIFNMVQKCPRATKSLLKQWNKKMCQILEVIVLGEPG